jgi:hypothetical protein
MAELAVVVGAFHGIGEDVVGAIDELTLGEVSAAVGVMKFAEGFPGGGDDLDGGGGGDPQDVVVGGGAAMGTGRGRRRRGVRGAGRRARGDRIGDWGGVEEAVQEPVGEVVNDGGPVIEEGIDGFVESGGRVDGAGAARTAWA